MQALRIAEEVIQVNTQGINDLDNLGRANSALADLIFLDLLRTDANARSKFGDCDAAFISKLTNVLANLFVGSGG